MKKLFLVGDSTMCDYDLTKEDRGLYRPRSGYGTRLKDRFGGIEVVNLALSGRSSKSFTKEKNYEILTKTLAEGDYLVIAFGHNDEKFLDEARFTFASGETSEEGSFKYYLNKFYVELALSRGAFPVLATPIVRRSASGDYSGDRVHKIGEVTSGGKTSPPADYAEAVRSLAAEKGIPLIDMTEYTKYYYEAVGADKTALMHATLGKTVSETDDTHLNTFGAHVVAGLFIDALLDSSSPLKNFVVPDPTIADESEIVVNKF